MPAEKPSRRWAAAAVLVSFLFALSAVALLNGEPAERKAESPAGKKTADGVSPAPGRVDGAAPRQDALGEAGERLLSPPAQQLRGVGLKDGLWTAGFRSLFFPLSGQMGFGRLTRSDEPSAPGRIVSFLHAKDGMK